MFLQMNLNFSFISYKIRYFMKGVVMNFVSGPLVYKQLNLHNFQQDYCTQYKWLCTSVGPIVNKTRSHDYFFKLYRGFGSTGLITDRACGKDNAIGGVRPSIRVLSVCWTDWPIGHLWPVDGIYNPQMIINPSGKHEQFAVQGSPVQSPGTL